MIELEANINYLTVGILGWYFNRVLGPIGGTPFLELDAEPVLSYSTAL